MWVKPLWRIQASYRVTDTDNVTTPRGRNRPDGHTALSFQVQSEKFKPPFRAVFFFFFFFPPPSLSSVKVKSLDACVCVAPHFRCIWSHLINRSSFSENVCMYVYFYPSETMCKLRLCLKSS